MKYKFALILILIIFGWVYYDTSVSAQTSQPLLQSSDLEYLGAFRLPRGANGDPNGFAFGGGPIAYNPANDSLFVATRNGGIGEVITPTPVINSNIESLPFATMVQNINTNPTEGGLSVLSQSSIRGLLVSAGKIYGTGSIYYDATNSARVSHFSRSTDLSAPSATPFKALWQANKSGLVGGWLAAVPSEWRSLLGGDVISGNCCVPIVTRTSLGPAAFSWNISDYDSSSVVPATPLLYYTGDNPTLGAWSGANSVYGGTTTIGGMVIPSGTRSLLYFGMNGTGTYCYGTGGASGGECVDPLSSDKGQHAYPYNYQVWAYDLNDLAAVKAGEKNPWDVRPYTTWTINDFPGVSISGISGVAYDSQNQIIYVSQMRVDKDGYSSRALIHAYKVKKASSVSSPAPAPASAPAPVPVPAPVTPTPIPTLTPVPSTGGGSSSPTLRPSTGGGGSSSSRPSTPPSFPPPLPGPTILRNLSEGMRGSDVVELQNFLINAGYLTSSNNTGYYGVLTKQAIEKYQCAKNITCGGDAASTGYGAVGPRTRVALAGATPASTGYPTPSTNTYSFTRDLTIGSRGGDVVNLQNYLISQGYLEKSNNTGYFGPMTQSALRIFQATKGLPSTGYFGSMSRTILNGQ